MDDLTFNGRDVRVLALDHLAHGINDADDPNMLLSAYVHGVDEFVRARFLGETLDVFFAGGGAYTLPRAWQQAYMKGNFVVAELDPAVTRIASEKLWFEPQANMEIRHGDARLILSELAKHEKFDVIFGDAFHDISIPQHLVSDEFHQLVKSRLRDDGIYIANVIDSFRKPRFLISLVKTLQQRFTSVELWLDLESVPEFDARVTWIVVAADKPSPKGTFTSTNGFYRQWARAPIDRMVEIVGPENVITLTDDFAPVDRLLANVIINSNLAE